MGHDTNLKGSQCELRENGNEETPGQAQALMANAHRAKPHVPRTCFRGQVRWESTCMRTTRGVQQLMQHKRTWSSVNTLLTITTYKAPEIKAGRCPESDLLTHHSQTPGYPATGFWTMFLQTSQMVRLAMNMPMSGTNTWIALPALAPFNQWREKREGGNSVVLILLWLNCHRVCLNLLKT